MADISADENLCVLGCANLKADKTQANRAYYVTRNSGFLDQEKKIYGPLFFTTMTKIVFFSLHS